jgi:hypothetical protein
MMSWSEVAIVAIECSTVAFGASLAGRRVDRRGRFDRNSTLPS